MRGGVLHQPGFVRGSTLCAAQIRGSSYTQFCSYWEADNRWWEPLFKVIHPRVLVRKALGWVCLNISA